ncbi:hypothetical protein V0288_18180 [Pannus brasiliensis CCIBt3594]|uniref:Uncharacterized protein n=1 Tax=Pannus brasiliensis CCIBt3594 TaxID=1427578 RepID=A0AAW9R043_9CHRO
MREFCTISNLEQLTIDTFRGLSPEKREEVLQFLDLLEPDIFQKPTAGEVRRAREILERATKRAIAESPQSPFQLFDEFNRIKKAIQEDYCKPDTI